MEATLDWKPNGHAALWLGIESGLSAPQRGGSTATLPVSQNVKISEFLENFLKKERCWLDKCVERVMIICDHPSQTSCKVGNNEFSTVQNVHRDPP